MEKSREEIINDLKSTKFALGSNGFVRFVDVMGDDAAIVQAARVSYGAGTKTPSDDRGLIRYLMRHRHTTPFEMAEVKLHIRIPMDAWRQFIRHRTANVNEYSTRYSVAIDEKARTGPNEWRLQSGVNKQGSDGHLQEWPDKFADFIEFPEGTDSNDFNGPGDYFSQQEARLHEICTEVYKERVNSGIAREQARKDLPLSTYTEAYWKCDLHNILHFLGLRMDSHAQLEIREYAETIGRKIIAPLFPFAWEAFEDYRLGSVALSRIDIEALRTVLGQCPVQDFGKIDLVKSVAEQEIPAGRELNEFIEKWKQIVGYKCDVV